MAGIKEIEHLTTPLERMTKDRDEWKAAYDDFVQRAHVDRQLYVKKINDLAAEVVLLKKELKARETAEILYLKKQIREEAVLDTLKAVKSMVDNFGEDMTCGHGDSARFLYCGTIYDWIKDAERFFIERSGADGE